MSSEPIQIIMGVNRQLTHFGTAPVAVTNPSISRDEPQSISNADIYGSEGVEQEHLVLATNSIVLLLK